MASIMSSTIVNVAIPGMSHHFALGQERAQWVSSGFMVAMTVSMLTTPWLLARYGYRRTYVGTMVLLLAGGIGGRTGQPLSAGAGGARGRGPGGRRGAADPGHHHPARLRAARAGPRERHLRHGRGAGAGHRARASAACWSTCSAGARSSSWWCPSASRSIWLAYKFVPTTAPGGVVAAARQRLDWGGLALGTVGTLCLLNGLVELRGGVAAAGRGAAGRRGAALRRASSPGRSGWRPPAARR